MGNFPYEIVAIQREVICVLGFKELAEWQRKNSGGLEARAVMLPLNLPGITY